MLPEMKSFKHEMGIEAKDLVTGFKGIIVCRSQYLTGCNRYSLQSRKITKDNKTADWVSFDEDQLEAIGKGISFDRKAPAGPPSFEPERR